MAMRGSEGEPSCTPSPLSANHALSVGLYRRSISLVSSMRLMCQLHRRIRPSVTHAALPAIETQPWFDSIPLMLMFTWLLGPLV